jgi:hypothetical protein
MTVCWVDTETTGLHPWQHEIWEIGLILPGGAEHRWFLPVDLGQADPFALEIGRYHSRHPNGYLYDLYDETGPVAKVDDDHGLASRQEFAQQFGRWKITRIDSKGLPSLERVTA